MKIALYMRNQKPSSGGAYTYEQQVINSLTACHKETSHEFVLMVPRQSREDAASQTAFETVFLPQTIQQQQPVVDLVFRHGVELVWNVMPSTCLVQEVPYISTAWDLQHRLQPFFPEVSSGGIWADRERRYRTQLLRAAMVLTGTERGKQEIGHFYGLASERIHVLPLPVPEFCLQGAADDVVDVRGRYALKRPFLFYPAQFWPHKNHIGLLLALKLLVEHFHMDLDLVLTGSDQGNLGYVRQACEHLRLGDRVHYLGFIGQSELVALYHNAACLSYVSFFGPDNLPPLEAFALGCPVVAADVPGAGEQLGDAAVLADPRSEMAIAQAIRQVLTKVALRQQLVASGKARASLWTEKHYIRKMFSLFDEFSSYARCWGGIPWGAA